MFANLIKRWEIKASTGNHFDVLDGLRGIAILLVVVFHTFYTDPVAGTAAIWSGYLIRAGWMGVPVFFVLSGFLISYPFMQRRQADPFFWYPQGYAARRIGKIAPPFYLSILIFLAAYWIQFHDTAYLDAAWKWATGLANWMYVPAQFNGSYWSLIIEAHFYIVLPLLFWLTRGLSLRNTALVLTLMLLLVPLLVRLLTYSDQPVLFDTMSRFPCKLDYFAWGVAFAGIYVGLASARPQLRWLGWLGNVGLVIFSVNLLCWHTLEKFSTPGGLTRGIIELSHWLPGVASFLLLFFLFDPECFMAKLIAAGWLRFTGIVSYEWFLFHEPVVSFFQGHIGHVHGNSWLYVCRTIVPLVLTFVFSAAIYRWFSLPILKGIRGALKRPRPKLA